tara:strand:+ start:653 stop:952 length:300 start_codon:yes stop_codon:yes gene_type:complete
MTTKTKEIDFKKFVSKFRVYKRRRGEKAGGYIFSPTGEDRSHVLDQVKHPFKRFTVWTLYNENGRKVIKAGYNIESNRIGHIISRKRWQNKENEIYIIK